MSGRTRQATVVDAAELVRLRAVALESLGRDPGPADAPWRHTAVEWFMHHISNDPEWICLVIGGQPGERLHASGIAWITHHLPSPRWPDGRRGYIDGMITDLRARRRGYARTLLDDLLAWLHQHGIDYIQLHASSDGQPLYAAAGFASARYPAMEFIPSSDHGAGSSG